MDTIYYLCVFICLFCYVSAQEDGPVYSIPLVTIDDCKTDEVDIFHEFYDSTTLSCSPCDQNSTYQTVTEDGLSCTCQSGYKKQGTTSSPWAWLCEECPIGQVASEDGWGCVECTSPCPDCPGQVKAERFLNGTEIVDNGTTISTCVACVNLTQPDADSARCDLCSGSLVFGEQPLDCDCPGVVSGGVCFRRDTDILTSDFVSFELDYGGADPILSELLMNNLQAAHGMCVNQTIQDPERDTSEYSNLTACQFLGNMCVLDLYNNQVQPPVLQPDICLAYRMLVYPELGPFFPFPVHNPGYRGLVNGIAEWRSSMPWLYYPENTDQLITKDTNIPTEFIPGSTLELSFSVYNLTGSYLGWYSASGALLQLCRGEDSVLDNSIKFGVKYKRECSIHVDALYDDLEYETIFRDLYLDFDGGTKLHAVPVLITNYRNENGQTINTGLNPEAWQLVRRYMFVDREGGKQIGPLPAERASILRYAQSMKLTLTLQDETNQGLIYPPLLTVSYSTVSDTQYGQNASVQVSFEVDYKMAMGSTIRDINIAVGVLSLVAVIYSGFRSHTWNRRSGKQAIDFLTLFEFLSSLCATLAASFFSVILGFSVWWWILYKGQTVFYMVPDTDADYYVNAYIGAAFALQFLYLLRMIGVQVSTDIFFVDWERPRGGERRDRHEPPRQLQLNATSGAVNKSLNDALGVSAWRTYFVANEWNELQTIRRVNPVFHMLLVVLLLNVVGLENWARYDTSTDLSFTPGGDHSTEYSVTFRFAVMAITYIIVAIAQWLLYLTVWSRFWQHPVVEFMDLCSNCNISLFLMTHDNFGYYIHGRNVHGHADVGLKEMHRNMVREEEDLCGHRGLLPNTDEQTFEVAIPSKLRTDYNKVLLNVNWRPPVPQGGDIHRRLEEDQEKRLQAYTVLNRFLQNFIDHNLAGLQYRVTDKSIWERILDTEFVQQMPDMGYFYTDYGHSFDKVLFYGNEPSLQLFEILFFTIVDFIFQNYVFAAIATYGMDVLICWSRRALGKRNIAGKTMVDKRLLI